MYCAWYSLTPQHPTANYVENYVLHTRSCHPSTARCETLLLTQPTYVGDVQTFGMLLHAVASNRRLEFWFSSSGALYENCLPPYKLYVQVLARAVRAGESRPPPSLPRGAGWAGRRSCFCSTLNFSWFQIMCHWM
jgi:hypothetical protein